MSFGVDFILFTGLLLTFHIILTWWKDAKRHKYPPSLPVLPIVGSLPMMRGFSNISEFLMKKSEQLGPIFTFKAGNKTILTLNSKEVIEEAYVRYSSIFYERGITFVNSYMNKNRKGLTWSSTSGENWKKYHKLTLSILKEFGFGVKNVMETRIKAEIEAFKQFVQKKNGKDFQPNYIATMLSANIISSIVFGHRREYDLGASDLSKLFHDLVNASDRIFDVAPITRFIPFYRKKFVKLQDCWEKIEQIITKEIKMCSNVGYEDCFIRRYVELEGPNYDQEELLHTVRDLIVAGTDTTANTILWLLIALANHPDIQQRLHKEIDAVISRDRLPILEDQKKLPLVEATILEGMRWRTLASLAAPRSTMNDTYFRGYFIPKGMLVLTNLHAAHMNLKDWKDPEVFQPDRFLDEGGNVVGKDRVIPFSLGRRSCLGEVLARAELFLIVTSILQQFHILPPNCQENIPVKPIEPIGAIVKPAPFEIRLITRPPI